MLVSFSSPRKPISELEWGTDVAGRYALAPVDVVFDSVVDVLVREGKQRLGRVPLVRGQVAGPGTEMEMDDLAHGWGTV